MKFDRACRSSSRIGDRNVFLSIARCTAGRNLTAATVIGNECYLMAAAHVGHNCVVGDHVIIVNSVLLAGYLHVGDYAIISGGAVIHQFTHVGRLAIISGNARVSKDVPLFTLEAENGEVRSLNLVACDAPRFHGKPSPN